jgi:hypothetical protein
VTLKEKINRQENEELTFAFPSKNKATYLTLITVNMSKYKSWQVEIDEATPRHRGW